MHMHIANVITTHSLRGTRGTRGKRGTRGTRGTKGTHTYAEQVFMQISPRYNLTRMLLQYVSEAFFSFLSGI